MYVCVCVCVRVRVCAHACMHQITSWFAISSWSSRRTFFSLADLNLSLTCEVSWASTCNVHTGNPVYNVHVILKMEIGLTLHMMKESGWVNHNNGDGKEDSLFELKLGNGQKLSPEWGYHMPCNFNPVEPHNHAVVHSLILTFSSSALWWSNRLLRAFKTSTSDDTPLLGFCFCLMTMLRSDLSWRETRHSKCSNSSYRREKKKRVGSCVSCTVFEPSDCYNNWNIVPSTSMLELQNRGTHKKFVELEGWG